MMRLALTTVDFSDEGGNASQVAEDILAYETLDGIGSVINPDTGDEYSPAEIAFLLGKYHARSSSCIGGGWLTGEVMQ
jgi:hypothetical protein